MILNSFIAYSSLPFSTFEEEGRLFLWKIRDILPSLPQNQDSAARNKKKRPCEKLKLNLPSRYPV